MKERYSLLFKILILFISEVGLVLSFQLLGIRGSLPFFTIISNLMCFIFYLFLVLLIITKKLNKNKFYYISKGAVTMSITLTMFVYQLMIAPNGLDVYEKNILACEIVHLIVPLLVLFDYFIFAEKGNIKKNYPIYWCTILFAYVIFVIIYSSLGGTFNGDKVPYFFLDIEKLGLFRVIIYCIIIMIFYIGCGHIAYVIDNKLENKKAQNTRK